MESRGFYILPSERLETRWLILAPKFSPEFLLQVGGTSLSPRGTPHFLIPRRTGNLDWKNLDEKWRYFRGGWNPNWVRCNWQCNSQFERRAKKEVFKICSLRIFCFTLLHTEQWKSKIRKRNNVRTSFVFGRLFCVPFLDTSENGTLLKTKLFLLV